GSLGWALTKRIILVQDLNVFFGLHSLNIHELRCDLIGSEHTPYLRQESRQLSREVGTMSRGLGKIQQFLTDNLVERCFEPELCSDRLCSLTLLNPNVMRFALSHRSRHPPIQAGFRASHSLNFDHRRRPEALRTAMATAFFWPTKTTSRLPLV